jgi:sugar phosphate permease
MIETTAPTDTSAKPFPRWLSFFAPSPPAATVLTDASAIQAGFRSWQTKILFSSIVGYATFYLVRKNLPVAMPVMEHDLGISKSQLGLFLTLHGVLYGVSKFTNGFFADRCNARAFMVIGLAASALLNLCFGLSSTVYALGLFWMLNGWVQGMGFPPCARLLTHWFSPAKLATKMSIWNTSHCIGGVVILVLTGFLVSRGWRLCFLVPAAIALVCVIFLWFTLADTPPSVGLPEVEGTGSVLSAEKDKQDAIGVLIDYVFRNKYIWLVSIANFFVYTLRYAVFDWGPTVLKEAKHIGVEHGAWMVAGFEVSGAIGALLGGWLTERFFGGRPMRACVFFMVFAGVSLFLFWKAEAESNILIATLLCCSGFFIYGPQCLIGIAAANLATKRAAASAVGLTGLFGYSSTLISGWGLGTLVKYHGWDAAFIGLLAVTAIGTLVCLAAWPAKAHGYSEKSHEA